MKQWFWIVPLLLVMMWLGARSLSDDAIWGDEYFSIIDSGGEPFQARTPLDVWNGVAQRNPWHVPGYFILLSGWGRLVGWEPTLLRALSLFCGVLAVAWTYRLGADTHSRRVGLIAVLLLTTSAFFIHFLHELRMYSLVALLSAFTVWIYGRVADRKTGWLTWAGLLVGMVGLLYTHYFAGLLVAAIGMTHLIFARKTKRWLLLIGLMAVVGLLFLPWVSALWSGIERVIGDDGVRIRALTNGEVLTRLTTLFGNGNLWLFLAAILLALPVRSTPRPLKRLWLIAVILLALMLLVTGVLEIILPARVRYLIALLPLVTVLISAGVVRLTARRQGWALAALLLGLWTAPGIANVVTLEVTRELDGMAYNFPMNEVEDALEDHSQPDDAVVIYLPEEGSARLYAGIDVYYYDDLAVDSILVDDPDTAQEQEDALDAIGDDRLRIWLTYVSLPLPSDLDDFEDVLDEDYNYCGRVRKEPDVALDLYTQSLVCCEPSMTDNPRLATFGAGITLTAIAPLEIQPNDTLSLLMGWQVDPEFPAQIYSVAAHIVDANGGLVAQADYGLPELAFSCQRNEINIADLPAGDYTLKVGVYNRQTNERLPGTLIATGEGDDLLPLATFHVETLR